MVENVARKVLMVAVLLGTALLLLLVPDKPFQLGLDLQGGTRLVYTFDIDEAIERGDISATEGLGRQQLISDTISILRNRVDPTGTLEASIRQEGEEKIVIELPGTLEAEGGTVAESTLLAALDETSATIEIDPQSASAFPERGGTIRIGSETIRYEGRTGTTLEGARRAQRNTPVSTHEAGALVELISSDAVRSRIESLGELHFLIVAGPADFTELATDQATERSKLEAWVAANPGVALANFNSVSGPTGPNPGIRWYAYEQDPEQPPRPELERATAVLNHQGEEHFRGEDLSRVYPTQDQSGYPAVGFEMRPARKGDFRDFTDKHGNRQMAIVLNGEISSAPRIDEPLPGGGIIRGQFTNEEVKSLITVLRSGSLKLAPQLEHEEVVGPTLGADYVRRGWLSGVVALGIVLVFMIAYYRRLGTFAAISLAATGLMLMGGLAFMQATLTLPGIAGIILTVGMAVDANILIFDRIREEAGKGRNIKQAAKTGFDKALSAILDANITTFLTAVILYRIGTGPVRGFAVTLMIGIVTSVFSALVITRLLVHLSLERGTSRFPMGRWMVEASYDFLSKTGIAAALSSVLVIGGVGLFAALPDQEKLGIDFTGGAEVLVQMEEPQPVDVIRQRVAAIEGGIGESSQVKPLLESADGEGFRRFRVTFKTEGESADAVALIRGAMDDVLIREGVRVTQTQGDTAAQLAIELYFDEAHPQDDVRTVLTAAGLTNPQVAIERQGVFTATAQTTSGLSDEELATRLKQEFRAGPDSNGDAYVLAQPIPSSSLVGPQVVGELRDKALLAIAISLFVTVLYIRARFAEYSYGFAAVAAVFHDVLVTLGVLAAANALGIVNGEINLPMIAAFLTIIGYSLNDTIVIFDRVRENLPRMKKPMKEILNLSINQTLSRTILTSITTFLAVGCLFVFNYGTGNVLESFSFAMMIGVLTGTYSTIFIANPILLRLEARAGRTMGGEGAERLERGGKAKREKSAVATTS